MLLLVGDNAFQGVNHLSQDKARLRVDNITDPKFCANLVLTSLENGADGFMFSVNDNTLSILNAIKSKKTNGPLSLHAIVPSAVDFIRLSGQKGMEGIAKGLTKKMILSGNVKAVLMCLKGLAKSDVRPLLSGLLSYEIAEIKSTAGKHAKLDSILLHELLTDMGLALDLKWLFELFISVVLSAKSKPGFETRNFALLVKKLEEWNIDVKNLLIVAPFNEAGFQMSPSKDECEQVLTTLPKASVIAINILASGYFNPNEAADYIKKLPNMIGVAVGISKESYARETFKQLSNLKG